MSEFILSEQFNPIAPELQQASLFYGIYSRIARRLGVTPQHVRQVAKGMRTSKRISKEITNEVRRITKREQRKLESEKAA